MLQSLFDRLLGRRPPPAPAVSRPPPRATDTGRAPALPRRPAAPAASADAPLGARRPLISAQGRIAGFEFQIGEAVQRRLLERGDLAAAGACTSSLLAAMRLCAQAGRRAYGELPAQWLLRAPGIDTLGQGVWLALVALHEVAPGSAAAAELADAIDSARRSGARIGWALDAPAPAGIAADFHTLHTQRHDDPAHWLQALRGAPSGVPIVALDLPGIDALEAALRAGVQLACCSVEAGAEAPEARPLTPATQRLLQLMNQLAQDAETPRLVAAIKADVSLSYRLLRQLNSAAVGGGAELGSIEQAVALLGRNELYRWVSVLLVRQAPQRPASPALQSMALARARLFELLAEAQGEPQPGALFTLGLASMLPLLLQTRLPDALAALQLHPLAEAALLEREGPWVAYLQLAEVLDESDLAEAAPLAEAFGGLPAVMSTSARAWLFAVTAQDRSDA